MKPKLITAVNGGRELQTKIFDQKILFICGILSSLLYVSTDILAAMQWEGYSYTSQAVSELMAVGAPTRPFVATLFSIYDILVIAFGIGICLADSRKRARFTGILLIGSGIVGLATLLFFPMHLRGAEKTLSDVIHAIFTGVTVLLILFSVGFGTALYGKRFRLYSIVTILVIILFGALAGMEGPKVAAQLPTPWLGIMERINIYSYLLWVLVLAVKFFRNQSVKA
ncbi:DUF998 domain-containing protein [Sinanaerobacter chloroacetimidivorans]|uniref:DUF998 domain-containing protein n=1 Tax=Sinanaerobacter chloroacetimidivorans TaxID=2818044 RepID=A0A8J7W587_9FIRM|nr:DUF998 domain-containing protein [Sinanaerobacter chloroacetimidivorans]MBR0599343.1 DUF998 domain-containing protein [Sinanaerobacter chloroacetimidivorans]